MKYKVAIYSHEQYAADILWGFTAAGHEAQKIYPYSLGDFDRIMGEVNPDLLILSSSMDYFQHSMLSHIGARQSPKYKVAYWDTEGGGQYNLQMAGFLLSKPDMIFSICPQMLESLKSKSIPCARLDFAYNPTIHYPKRVPGSDNTAISLVGNAWLWYARYYPAHFRYSKSIPVIIKPLIENNQKIDFYGTTEYKTVIKDFLNLDVPIEWFKGVIPYWKTCDIYNGSFINLITQNHEQTITRRTFEILGSGGFGLSCYNSAVNDLFGNSGGLVLSNSSRQTLDLFEHYSSHKDEYQKVRENAVRCVKNHTYKERAEEIIKKVFAVKE